MGLDRVILGYAERPIWKKPPARSHCCGGRRSLSLPPRCRPQDPCPCDAASWRFAWGLSSLCSRSLGRGCRARCEWSSRARAAAVRKRRGARQPPPGPRAARSAPPPSPRPPRERAMIRGSGAATRAAVARSGRPSRGRRSRAAWTRAARAARASTGSPNGWPQDRAPRPRPRACHPVPTLRCPPASRASLRLHPPSPGTPGGA